MTIATTTKPSSPGGTESPPSPSLTGTATTSATTSAPTSAARPTDVLPTYICMARSNQSDGTFELLLDGVKRGMVVSRKHPGAATTAGPSSMYTFVDDRGQDRQKPANVEDLRKEYAPFSDLVEPAYAPDRHVRDHQDILTAAAQVDRKVQLYTHALNTLRSQKRQLDTLAHHVSQPRKLRRTTTLLPEEHSQHTNPFPSYWRIRVPVFPEHDRRALCKQMDRALADPEMTTMGVVPSNQTKSHPKSQAKNQTKSSHTTFLSIDDLVAEAHLSKTASITLQAIVEEMRQRCKSLQPVDKSLPNRCVSSYNTTLATTTLATPTLANHDETQSLPTEHTPPPPQLKPQPQHHHHHPNTQPTPYTIRLHRYEPLSHDEWSQHRSHTSVTAVIPLCVESMTDHPEPSGPPVPTMEFYTEQHGRGQVDLVEGGVYAFTGKVWRMRRNGEGVRWYGVEIEVGLGR